MILSQNCLNYHTKSSDTLGNEVHTQQQPATRVYGRLDELTVPSDWSAPNSGDVPAPVIALVVNPDTDLIINNESDGHDSETDSDSD